MPTHATWFDRLPAGARTALDANPRLHAHQAWAAAQDAVIAAVMLRASVERRHGRIEVADALEASVSESSLSASSADYL